LKAFKTNQPPLESKNSYALGLPLRLDKVRALIANGA